MMCATPVALIILNAANTSEMADIYCLERMSICCNLIGMKLQDIPESLQGYFEQTPDVLGGKLRVRGTRISVEQVLEMLEAGLGHADIAQSFPSLTQPDVAAVERLAAHCDLLILQ